MEDVLKATHYRGRRAGGSLREQARKLIEAMGDDKHISDGQFSALGMLITDASLSADEDALVEVKDGLQWLHRTHYLDVPASEGEARERRGRILGLIDVVHWALRRLPSGMQLTLQPSSYAARFLVEVARERDLCNKDLAGKLGADETEVSRVGRRLLAAGLVWKRKQWRQNSWDITPRGQAYLEESGLGDAVAAATPSVTAGATATEPGADPDAPARPSSRSGATPAKRGGRARNETEGNPGTSAGTSTGTSGRTSPGKSTGTSGSTSGSTSAAKSAGTGGAAKASRSAEPDRPSRGRRR
ncbi:winged helix-turn-helix transcriptional regulator [Actinomadura barringtoniae]|uniref:Winged helix-turn-helix transcriptional regulator n=1 Tax=Actinomadura barringtoniae TaxID=1427535 RepID=A0A939P5S1_9ACTN|nr:MarR family winged helix-turn-helix transcriptional regulator [Actinomadura barringtoniae]MBO2445708.1 winged helix-turn-helix transcriptional regulator [Actinomadura barringtoniae]